MIYAWVNNVRTFFESFFSDNTHFFISYAWSVIEISSNYYIGAWNVSKYVKTFR